MSNNYRKMEYNEFLQYIDKICENLEKYIQDNGIKIDYTCPILRSGAVPAVYISNKLNIIKFLPIQAKHIAYKDGQKKIEIIFNPLTSIEIQKEEPVFLIVEAKQHTGTTIGLCINEIKQKYKNAKILYVCIAKKYGSCSFEDFTSYEDVGFYYTENNELSEEKCKGIKVESLEPLFPWENLETELEHPDDLEENIFF
ncbi:MAG: phosphoribosyltransferase [Clostridia bacterium]|nr:phosphoribosyltransferase [Clostridia bacterium]